VTERAARYHPHLWVPDGPTAEAEICTLCGAFLTPDNSGEDCPESLPEEIAANPPEMPPEIPPPDQAEPADGWDDEQRYEVMPPP
jgi:hypothetical protein